MVKHIGQWNFIHPDNVNGHSHFLIVVGRNVVVVGICSPTSQEMSGLPIWTILGSKSCPANVVGDVFAPQQVLAISPVARSNCVDFLFSAIIADIDNVRS